jgi:mono/diheme cytochrome c family protein
MRYESSRGSTRAGVVASCLTIIVGLSACGDPDTPDRRGYTKAPLEQPGVLVRGETPSPMRALGQPNRTRADRIELPDEPPPAAAPAEPTAPTALPPGVTQDMVTTGRQLYEGQGACFSCHAMDASGTPIGPNLRDGEWLHIDGSLDALAAIITTGVPTPLQYPAPMPAMGGAALTEEQVRQIAAYLYSLNPR